MNNLAKKLILVMKDCSYVQKNATNSAQKYNYASASAVLEKVNDSLSRHGIATCSQTELISDLSRETNGKIVQLVTVKTTITLFDGEGEPVTISALGSGMDFGDKAIAKAQTMALKYAWMNTLNISTGDDPEADESVEEGYHKPQHIEQRAEPYPSFVSPLKIVSPVSSSAEDFAERYNKAKSQSEYWSVFKEAKPFWDTFTKEERNLIIQVSSAAKERLGMEMKNGKTN